MRTLQHQWDDTDRRWIEPATDVFDWLLHAPVRPVRLTASLTGNTKLAPAYDPAALAKMMEKRK